jgi:hypothetical protein
MVRLLSVVYIDRYAFVEDRGVIYSIRPPFKGPCKEKASPEMVEISISRHGFIRTEREFSSWKTLIAYLSERMMKAYRATSYPGASLEEMDEVAGEIIATAPERILWQFVYRLKNEVLPQKEFLAAQKILGYMLSNDVLTSTLELLKECIGLLQECNKGASRMKDEMQENLGVALTGIAHLEHGLTLACSPIEDTDQRQRPS